jgi:DNA-binding FadR family transcriptional regulator
VVARLREALAQLADGGGDSAARVEADLGFHLLLCQPAGNSMLVEAWRYLEGRIRVAIMNGRPDNTPPMMSLDRYSPIVDAIEKGDVPAAVAVVEEHMAAAAEHFADARDAD